MNIGTCFVVENQNRNMKLIETKKSGEISLNSLKIPQNIIVFSHLRWDFVYQRPQHLLSRFAQAFNVTFIEEPVFDGKDIAYYSFSKRDENVIIMVPHICPGLSQDKIKETQKEMFNEYMANKNISNYAFWYYTPMALEFSRKYTPDLVIYDCMDELSAFKFAPERLRILEQELLKIADVVFTGGVSLYEAKKNQHSNIHPFPSSIEKKHFLKARDNKNTPADQVNSLLPKLGFYGVIDERFDIELIRHIATERPDWQIVLIGPIVKIDEGTLPRNANIHYLGPRDYKQLPLYMSGWDVALIPFLLNESTQFISPTKTPEYLAAGLPVVSTAIRDVINPYGTNKLVEISYSAADFVAAIERQLSLPKSSRKNWLNRVDQFLSFNSWDKTYDKMLELMKQVIINKLHASVAQ